MKRKFVRCEFCNIQIPSDTCKLSTYQTVINREEYVFCCKNCAERFQRRRENRTK